MTCKAFPLILLSLAAASGASAQLRAPAPAAATLAQPAAAVLPAPLARQKSGVEDGRQILRSEIAASQAALRGTMADPGGCDSCIVTINGKPAGRVTFTPGTEDLAAAYTISGFGFGDTPGSVYLGGAFNVRPELRVDSWRNDRIVAYFPRGLRGETDKEAISLTVKLPDGRLIQTPPAARFMAAREPQILTIDDIPPGSIRAQGDPALTMMTRDGGLLFRGTDSGDAVKRGFTDRVVLDFLKPGFEGAAFSVGFCRTDTGNVSQTGAAGGRYLYGRYDARWDGDDIVIDRAMWQDHRSPDLATPARNIFQSCFRDLKITVIGPAGIRPLK